MHLEHFGHPLFRQSEIEAYEESLYSIHRKILCLHTRFQHRSPISTNPPQPITHAAVALAFAVHHRPHRSVVQLSLR